ncbi:Replication-associated recombination protein RarA [hydrothermal vent metagenome]|uniref:Replication-associated recombination protein RarA n=1 Tax=hydrothermal vent metagenome TaxID=652676 RepID=A0A3B0VKR1_9ZZZZ
MKPLASRIRPKSLDEFVGQKNLVGNGKTLRVAIEKKHNFSFILWGPPGTGKTTIARIYARALKAELFELSAVSSGKGDIRKIIDSDTKFVNKVLLLDEIHRFNKAQQDFLLPFVENGEITLIGATTENPSFEIIPALLSRCRVFTFESLSDESLKEILLRAKIPLDKNAIEWIVRYADGDARKALGIIDSAKSLYGDVNIKVLEETLNSPNLRYDKLGDEHYDTISAFIKSMRAGQSDSALYYLARMVSAGEDPLFIARRMVIFASEDVGIAQPTALVVANAVFRACETIGYPECSINLAHGVVYLSESKKNRSAYDAFRLAQEDVKKFGNLPIPKKIRNATTKLMENLEYGKGYEKYDTESYLPEKLVNNKRRYLK